MARDLALHHFAAGTRTQYLRCCCDFVRYHMKSPMEFGMGEADVKEYLHRVLPRCSLACGPVRPR